MMAFIIILGIIIFMIIKAFIMLKMSAIVLEAIYQYNLIQIDKGFREKDPTFKIIGYNEKDMIELILFDWTFSYKNIFKYEHEYELCKPYIKKVFWRKENDN